MCLVVKVNGRRNKVLHFLQPHPFQHNSAHGIRTATGARRRRDPVMDFDFLRKAAKTNSALSFSPGFALNDRGLFPLALWSAVIFPLVWSQVLWIFCVRSVLRRIKDVLVYIHARQILDARLLLHRIPRRGWVTLGVLIVVCHVVNLPFFLGLLP